MDGAEDTDGAHLGYGTVGDGADMVGEATDMAGIDGTDGAGEAIITLGDLAGEVIMGMEDTVTVTEVMALGAHPTVMPMETTGAMLTTEEDEVTITTIASQAIHEL
mgnify:CR=1 FL=1